MYIISTMDQSIFVEKAIQGLQLQGISKQDILAIPLIQNGEPRALFDTLHHSDGISLLDGASLLGTFGMAVGTIYGFRLAWGPILWGLIGLFGGFIVGLVLDLLISKDRKVRKKMGGKRSEVVLMIRCDENDAPTVEKILKQNFAMGLGRLRISSTSGLEAIINHAGRS